MKQQFHVAIAIAALMTVTACNVKTADDYKKETDEIIRKSQEDMDRLTDPLYRGGQPGKITVKGIIVKKESAQLLLDDRIKVEQVGGKGNRGVSQTIVSDANKAILTESAEGKDLSTASASGKFINLGCENLTAEDTAGLTEESSAALADSVVSLSAKKIFVCGSPAITQSFVSLTAEQIILKSAVIKIKNVVGSLSISAAKLVIEGENVVETQGLDAVISVMPAPSLDFTVTQAIDGEGKLAIRSVGGNCVEKQDKK